MSFNYDFPTSAAFRRPLREPETPGNLSVYSTVSSIPSFSSMASSSASGSLTDYITIMESPKIEEKKKETTRFVQQGMRDINILRKYNLNELQVPDELVLTWLPGYSPIDRKSDEEEQKENLTPTRSQTYRCVLKNVTPRSQ